MIDVFLAGLLATQAPPSPPEPPALTPLLAAQVEAHLLRTQLYTQTLSVERQRIDAAIAATWPGWRMDWQTMRLVPVQPEKDAPR